MLHYIKLASRKGTLSTMNYTSDFNCVQHIFEMFREGRENKSMHTLPEKCLEVFEDVFL